MTSLLLLLLVSLCFVNTSESESNGKMVKVAPKGAKRVYRKTIIGEGPMTEAMIESCIVLNGDIADSSAITKKIESQLDLLKQEMMELNSSLKENKETLEHADSSEIDAYNEKIQSYQSKLDEYNEQIRKYNKEVGYLKEMAGRFEVQCKGQSFYKDEYEKVVKKLGYGMPLKPLNGK